MNRRLILVIALPLLLIAGYFIAGFLWQEHDATTPPPPQPTSTAAATPADPLAEYKKIQPASCPPSIDPNLRRYFYREGQCPTSKGAKE